jgi:hypothetical protein
MGVALEVFLCAEDHVEQRHWAHSEKHRVNILLGRFNDKVETLYAQAKHICNTGALVFVVEPSGASESDSDMAEPAAALKAVKLQRGTAERNRKRKRRKKAGATSEVEAALGQSRSAGDEEEVDKDET